MHVGDRAQTSMAASNVFSFIGGSTFIAQEIGFNIIVAEISVYCTLSSVTFFTKSAKSNYEEFDE